MGEHGSVSVRDDHKIVVIECPNGMSYIGQSVFGAGARKGEEGGAKIKDYVVVRSDGLLGEVFSSQKSFEAVAKTEYQNRAGTRNPGTFQPGSYVLGVHNLDEHL